MERAGDRQGKMERHCSTGQIPQRAVVPIEKEVVKFGALVEALRYKQEGRGFDSS